MLVGYVVSLANILTIFFLLDLIKIFELVIMFGGGIAIGFGFSRVQAFRGLEKVFAFSAFLAALTFWMPMILATYGFALLAVPVLGLYSIAVLIGWNAGFRWLNKDGK